MMKKPLSLAMVAALLLALFACGVPAPIPNPPLVLGEKYLTELDYEQALLQFDQAISIEPKNPRGYLGKADALLHLDRQAEAASALADGAKATRGDTRSTLKAAQVEVAKSPVDGYIGLSACYERLGWREIALMLLKRVCEELPVESRLREALERLLNAYENKENPAMKSGKPELAFWAKNYTGILNECIVDSVGKVEFTLIDLDGSGIPIIFYRYYRPNSDGGHEEGYVTGVASAIGKGGCTQTNGFDEEPKKYYRIEEEQIFIATLFVGNDTQFFEVYQLINGALENLPQDLPKEQSGYTEVTYMHTYSGNEINLEDYWN